MSLTTTTAGAELRFTLDGSIPTPASSLYRAALTLHRSSTLTVRGFRKGFQASPISRAVFVITTGASTGAGVALQQDSGGLLAIEAERFAGNSPRSGRAWVVQTDPSPGFSGSAVMVADPDGGPAITSDYAQSSPQLSYVAHFVAPGTHYVWVRGRGSSAASNSVHAGLDAAESATAEDVTVPISPSGYGWSDGSHTLEVPSAGLHTVDVWMREDGTVIDRIVLTVDPQFVPLGLGPRESLSTSQNELPFADDFADGNAEGWILVEDAGITAEWQVVNGALEQRAAAVGLFDGSYRRGTYAYLGRSLTYHNYRLSLQIRPTSESRRDVGVMFRYRGVDDYYRLSFNAEQGYTRFEKRVGGQFTTLARDSRGYRPADPLDVTIEGQGPLVHVFVDGEPTFSAYDTDLLSGGIALYTQDQVGFDEISVTKNDPQPRSVMAAPLAYSVTPNAPAGLEVGAVVRHAPAGATVEFRVDDAFGGACQAALEGPSGWFASLCTGLAPGDYEVDAILRDRFSIEVDRDTNLAVGVANANIGSNHYVTIGDSITAGVGDNYTTDNISLDGRTIASQGWQSVLGDLITATTGLPALAANEGIGGDKTSDVLNARLAGDLERNPDAAEALIMLGTNDARDSVALPSGAGCSPGIPGDCDGTFKGNLLAILAELPAGMVARLPLLPPAFGRGAPTEPYDDPLDPLEATRTERIRQYNEVIAQELVTAPDVELGPDFFSCFLRAAQGADPEVNRFSLFADNLHLNGLGQVFFAHKWHDALTGTAVVPGAFCDAPIFIVEELEPASYKQNLIEPGNRPYLDEAYTVTDLPALLDGAVWIQPENADADRIENSGVVRFDLGSQLATIYIAYDAAATPPNWLTSSGFMPTAAQVGLAGAPVGTLRLYRREDLSGVVDLGGNRGIGAAGAQVNYIPIVVEQ